MKTLSRRIFAVGSFTVGSLAMAVPSVFSLYQAYSWKPVTFCLGLLLTIAGLIALEVTENRDQPGAYRDVNPD